MTEFFASLRETLQAFLEAHQYKALAVLIGVEEAGVPLPPFARTGGLGPRPIDGLFWPAGSPDPNQQSKSDL